MDGIYATSFKKQSENPCVGRKVKRFDFTTDDVELLVMNIGDDTYVRLLGTDDGLMVDIRKFTRNKYHKNGSRVSAKNFRLAIAKLIDELNDIEAREAVKEAKNRVVESNFNIKSARPMPEKYNLPYKTTGNESVIFYAK